MKWFSDYIGTDFGLSKCVKATFKTGKLEKSDHVQLDEETMIKDLEQEKVYKYLVLMSQVEFNMPQWSKN